jgi:hypothetical protein
MNLYIDKYYKSDSENKINYASLLFNNTTDISGYTLTPSVATTYVSSQPDCIVIISNENLNNVHMYVSENNTVRYLQETLISDNAKKFIITI